MQIVADSASLYSPEDGEKLGFKIVPACVVINGKTYKDFEEITVETFLKMVEEGGVPTSSQPAIGDIMEVFEEAEKTGEDVLFLPVGDGLSGAYQSAAGLASTMENKDRLHVLNTKTLAGPQRYFVQKALKLKEEGLDIERIKRELIKSIESSVSFVIPADFDFLRRSGRLIPIAAKIAGMIKIVPVMTQTEDKTRIQPFAIKRSRKKALEAILDHLKSMGVNEEYIISIGHGGAYELGKEIFEYVQTKFTNTMVELFQLSPSLVTHGGPGCITIQAVRK